MSIEKRRTATVYGIIRELFADGKTSVRPGDVNSVLRERGMPMGTWEVRAEFSSLEAQASEWLLLPEMPFSPWPPNSMQNGK